MGVLVPRTSTPHDECTNRITGRSFFDNIISGTVRSFIGAGLVLLPQVTLTPIRCPSHTFHFPRLRIWPSQRRWQRSPVVWLFRSGASTMRTPNYFGKRYDGFFSIPQALRCVRALFATRLCTIMVAVERPLSWVQMRFSVCGLLSDGFEIGMHFSAIYRRHLLHSDNKFILPAH